MEKDYIETAYMKSAYMKIAYVINFRMKKSYRGELI